MEEQFKQFLKDNQAFYGYIDERQRSRNYHDSFFANVDPQCFLTMAFLWIDSEMGFDYWADLNEQWLKVVSNEG